MKSVVLNLPTLGFLISTRAALAFGAGLLLSRKFSDARRRTIGLTLVTVGAAATIPIALSVFRNVTPSDRSAHPGAPGSSVDRDEQLVGVKRFARKGDEPA